MSRMSWRLTRKKRPPQPEPQPAPEPVAIVESLSDEEGRQKRWTGLVESKYQAILNAQSDMQTVLHELNEHVVADHDGDISECDMWCWPRMVRRTIACLDQRERGVFLMILLKDWYWRQAAMEPWLADDGPES